MIAILVAKWVADALEKEGVYDLAQTVLRHPFLDLDRSLSLAQMSGDLTEVLLPPPETMAEITVNLPSDGCIPRIVLSQKLQFLRRRGLMDAGLVLASRGMLQVYLSQGELHFGVNELANSLNSTDNTKIRLLGTSEEGEVDLSQFVDRTPLTVCATAPVEYAVVMFGNLGLKYLCVVEEGSGRILGVNESFQYLVKLC